MSERNEILDGIGEKLRRLHAADQELPDVMRELLKALEKLELGTPPKPPVLIIQDDRPSPDCGPDRL